MPKKEQRLRALARRQHGVFLLRQAVEFGFARSTIARRLECCSWEEVLPRVYRSAVARPVDWRQLTMAMTLVTNGVASGPSAGALFGLVAPPAAPEVTA